MMSGDKTETSMLDESFFDANQALVGRQFGHYHVIGELGKGGMATVYKADEQSLNRVVALKVMSPKISDDPTMIKRFEREAQAAAQLNHPSIVHIYAIGEEKGVHFFTMEYIKGKSLAQLRREKGALTPAEAIPHLIQVAEALGEAHRHGMVHRDIKPSNIMLDNAGRVKVTDFGIAHVASAQTQLTVAGSFLGTPQYMSPEQCEGKPVDGRSDIYSLGVTFYELITGRSPFEAETPGSMLVKIVKGEFRPIQEIDPTIPAGVRTVIEKMLKTNPKKRYQNADEVITALKNLEKVVVQETGATAFGKTMATVAPAAPAPKKKNRWLLPAAAALLLVVLASTAVVLGPRRKDRKGAEPMQAERSDTAAGVTAAEAPPPGREPPPEATPLSRGTDEAALVPSKMPESAPPRSEPDSAPVEPVVDRPPAEPVAAPPEPAPTPEPQPAPAAEPAVTPPVVPPEDASALDATPEKTPVPVAPTTPEVPDVLPVAEAGDAQESPPPEPGPELAMVVQPPAVEPPPPVAPPAAPPPSRPPDDSLIVMTSVDYQLAGIVTSHAQSFLKGSGYGIIDKVLGAEEEPVNVAQFELLIEISRLGTTQLQYMGRNSDMHTDALTMKLVQTSDGKVLAGPFKQTAQHTALNAEKKLEEAVRKLTVELREAIDR